MNLTLKMKIELIEGVNQRALDATQLYLGKVAILHC